MTVLRMPPKCPQVPSPDKSKRTPLSSPNLSPSLWCPLLSHHKSCRYSRFYRLPGVVRRQKRWF
uniref:Uncharacterized protein n=1 Tax=Myoviridae sp. ctt8G1 TaxID=2827713 RepID=A0A8S5TFV3_9CAUD|nr:MAG TPA: hypothetical protein [Myoviridae sp. ctt8G1]